ncbi:MAG TPA: hypothetical protein VJ576_02565 [Rhodocyclaceae bacterium]|nr:hypothetical protein [Rhodocyclaceae bacterium]
MEKVVLEEFMRNLTLQQELLTLQAQRISALEALTYAALSQPGICHSQLAVDFERAWRKLAERDSLPRDGDHITLIRKLIDFGKDGIRAVDALTGVLPGQDGPHLKLVQPPAQDSDQ